MLDDFGFEEFVNYAARFHVIAEYVLRGFVAVDDTVRAGAETVSAFKRIV